MTEDIRSVFDELRSPSPDDSGADDRSNVRSVPLSATLSPKSLRPPQAPPKRVRLSATPWMAKALSDLEGGRGRSRDRARTGMTPSLIAILAVLGATLAAGVVIVVELANPPKPRIASVAPTQQQPAERLALATTAPAAAAPTSAPRATATAAAVSVAPADANTSTIAGTPGAPRVRSVRTVAIDGTGAPAQKDPVVGTPVNKANVDLPTIAAPLSAAAPPAPAPAAPVLALAANSASRTAAAEAAAPAPTPRPVATAPAATPSVAAAKPAPASPRSTVNVDANMRGSKGGDKIAVVPAGSPVEVLSCDAAWCQVSYSGKRGFVYRPFIKDLPATLAKR